MLPGAFHPHSCCVSNAEPQQQRLSPVSWFLSFRKVRIITSLGYCQLRVKSRELIESQIANRSTDLFHVLLNKTKLVQCDIHFKPHYYNQTQLLRLNSHFIYLDCVLLRMHLSMLLQFDIKNYLVICLFKIHK